MSLCNSGACDLRVAEVALRCQHQAFRLINNPFPATLRPASCLSVVVQYHAIEKEPRACELVIHSNDPDAPVTCLDVVAHTIWDCCCGCCDEPRKSCCGKRPKECCKEHRHECCDEDWNEKAPA